jgi:hypothetical protein
MAMVPRVLVSKISRTLSISTPSTAPSRPMPALLTSTSSGPAASTAARMLCASVTSSGRMRSLGDAGSRSARGVRMVATTFQSRARKYLAISRPKPDEQPVIRTVFM